MRLKMFDNTQSAVEREDNEYRDAKRYRNVVLKEMNSKLCCCCCMLKGRHRLSGAGGLFRLGSGFVALLLRLDGGQFFGLLLDVALLELLTVLDDALDDNVRGDGAAAVNLLEDAALNGRRKRVGAVVVSGVGLAVHNDVDLEVVEQLVRDDIRRADDNLVDVLAGQDAEHALVQVHDRVVLALEVLRDRVRVDADDDVIAVLLGSLEGVHVADMEEIPGTRHVDDPVARLWFAAVGKLDQLLRGRQKLRHAGVRALRSVAGAEVAQRLVVDVGQRVLVIGVVLGGEQEHPADEVGGGDALRALALLIATGRLDQMVRVDAVGSGRDVVAVHAEVAVVLVEDLHGRHIGSVLHHLVHPLAGAHHLVPLLLVHDGRALVLLDLSVAVDAHDEVVAHRLCLPQRVGVAKVHHVVAAIAPDAHNLLLLASGRGRLTGH
eukprot:m.71999 g.71999  ORF g.71999 m.71999 type:complete len:435 (-) comp14396_c0_seq1:186-1490(-)